MIRELRHLLDVLRGRVPVKRRQCDNPRCCRVIDTASKFEAARFGQSRTVRCSRCYRGVMQAVPAPADTDGYEAAVNQMVANGLVDDARVALAPVVNLPMHPDSKTAAPAHSGTADESSKGPTS